MKVRFAVSLDPGKAQPGHLASLVTGAEDRGFDTLWFADVPLVNAVDPTLAVAFAAGLSHRLRLGVDLVPFGHESFVVARQLAQLDQLTDGRLLVTVVRGLDLPGERAALGIAGRDRGRLLDALLPELRTWWAGSTVTVGKGEAAAEVTLPVLPRQDPLEVWLGGHGPQAVRRAGRLADGWLGSGGTLGPRRGRRAVPAHQGGGSRRGARDRPRALWVEHPVRPGAGRPERAWRATDRRGHRPGSGAGDSGRGRRAA